MKLSTILIAALAVMMIFAIAPMASAGNGSSSRNPIEVYYLGWQWEYGGSSGTSMGHFPGATDYGLSSCRYKLDNTTPYTFYRFTYAELDTFNTVTVPSQYYTGKVWGKNYDLFVADMFFSTYMNNANPNFLSAINTKFNDGTNTTKPYTVSIFSEDYLTQESFAPDWFTIRDVPNESASCAFTTNFFNGITFAQASSLYADWDDWIIISNYIKNDFA